MGVVYEAFDRDHGTTVALKCLPSGSPEAVARFKSEFRLLQDVHQENLVKLGDLVHEDGQLFFTMELVEGVSLVSYCWRLDRTSAERAEARVSAGPEDATLDDEPVQGIRLEVKRAKPPLVMPDETRLRSAFAQLVRALCALHAADKVHRDVKPNNVLVTRGGRVVLLDFGVVADLGACGETADDRLIGTPAY